MIVCYPRTNPDFEELKNRVWGCSAACSRTSSLEVRLLKAKACTQLWRHVCRQKQGLGCLHEANMPTWKVKSGQGMTCG